MNVNPKTADTLRRALPTSEAREIKVRDVQFGFGTHVILFLMRWFLRPWLARALRGSPERIAKIQIQMASRLCKNSSGLPLDYDIPAMQDYFNHRPGEVTQRTAQILAEIGQEANSFRNQILADICLSAFVIRFCQT